MARVLKTVFLALFMASLGCEWVESPETTYANLDAAKKANAVGPGKWIPEFLPTLARNIREKHNLDTNEVWLSFHAETAGLASIPRVCKEVPEESILLPRSSPGNWWPQGLVRHSEDGKDMRKMFVYFQCQNGGNLATDLKRVEVFYWDTVSRPPVR
jgi:hypothetical protein